MTDSMDPAELIRRYGVLQEAVTPLATLAKVSPSMLEDVIRLAMAMGIHAAELKRQEDAKFAIAESAVAAATSAFWKSQRPSW